MGWQLPAGGFPELARTISKNLYGAEPTELDDGQQDVVVAYIAGRTAFDEATVRAELVDVWSGHNEARGEQLAHMRDGPVPVSDAGQARSVGQSALGAWMGAQSTSGTDAVTSSDKELSLWEGARDIADRGTFDTLARRDDVPGAMGVREVKFLVLGVDTDKPEILFMNTNSYPLHYKFATGALGMDMGIREFNSQTYFKDDRKMMAGSILAHDNFTGEDGDKGLFALEFWPTDPVKGEHVATAFDLVKQHMPFADGKLAYHPAGETQRRTFARDEAVLEAAGVRSVDTTELLGNVDYSPLNLGTGFGTLRVVDGSDPVPPTVRDVVIFKNIPNDLSHVGGVITEEPQTPLSHVNLKAKQNETPNAFIKDAANDPDIAPLIGKLVKYEVSADGFTLREATPEEAAAHLESVRPTDPQHPARDLSATSVTPLDAIGHGDVDTYGAKAANVAELKKILPADMVPDGFAVPFAIYDSFMKETGLYEEAAKMMADPKFKSDPAHREKKLKKLRKKIKKAEMPKDLARELMKIPDAFPPGTSLRARSSTNNEDLEGFNGAGLYDSKTYRPAEGEDFCEEIQKVFSSLWSFRAFEERDFYRIDHHEAAMGVLVHPNFDDEEANGVAVTKNIYDENWEGFYVNVQVGEALVTNPEGGATPDEMLISAIGPNGEFEVQRLQESNLTDDGKPVLGDKHMEQLRDAMQKIQRHFAQVYGKSHDRTFAMDIEFKVDKDGDLVVKQARPWVD